MPAVGVDCFMETVFGGSTATAFVTGGKQQALSSNSITPDIIKSYSSIYDGRLLTS